MIRFSVWTYKLVGASMCASGYPVSIMKLPKSACKWAPRLKELNGKLTKFWLLCAACVAAVTVTFIIGVSHLIIKPLNVVTASNLIPSENAVGSFVHRFSWKPRNDKNYT
jgi:hypothetical protein